MAEQEAIYGSKPSPSKSGAKSLRPSTGGPASKRFSLGGAALQTALDKATPSSRSLHKKNPVKRQTLNNNHHHAGLAALSSGKVLSQTLYEQTVHICADYSLPHRQEKHAQWRG